MSYFCTLPILFKTQIIIKVHRGSEVIVAYEHTSHLSIFKT